MDQMSINRQEKIESLSTLVNDLMVRMHKDRIRQRYVRLQEEQKTFARLQEANRLELERLDKVIEQEGWDKDRLLAPGASVFNI